MPKSFSDDDLSINDVAALTRLVEHGDVSASVVVLASVARSIDDLTESENAELALRMGPLGPAMQAALSNLSDWFRDQYPGQIDTTIATTKFSTLEKGVEIAG